MRSSNRTAMALWAVLVAAPVVSLAAERCVPGGNSAVVTDHFFFTASSDQGAVGDVVGVEFALTLEDPELILDGVRADLYCFELVGCYDEERLELLEQVRYSELYDEFAFLSLFYPLGEADRLAGTPGGSFILGANIQRGAVERFLASGDPFPLATAYFRIRGEGPGETEVSPCEDVRVGWSCEATALCYHIGVPGRFRTRSTRHVPGVIRILPGEPTHPDPPDLPPDAQVYPEAPTAESARIHFELEGPAVARPGAEDLAFELYVTSNYEFSGFMTALRFPPEHLELTRVEEHTRPGLLEIDNQAGGFGLLMSNSRRRAGREGERVHLATLHFRLLEAAREAREVELRFAPFASFLNWLAIHHRGGVTEADLPVTAEVTPLAVTDALLAVQSEPTRPGDVNLDYDVNLTDPVDLLGTLFRGTRAMVCPEAADFNEDGSVNLSDAVAILNHLFRGGPAPEEREVFCGEADAG